MRAYVLGFVGIVGIAGIAVSIQTAGATPSPPSAASLASGPISMPAASHKCGKGQHWVPAGYAKHGKYRVGHCASSSS